MRKASQHNGRLGHKLGAIMARRNAFQLKTNSPCTVEVKIQQANTTNMKKSPCQMNPAQELSAVRTETGLPSGMPSN